MPHLAQDRLALVRQLYESSELTIAEIAVLADVSESAIYQRARREQWTNSRRPGVTPRKQKLRPPVAPTPALLAVAGLDGPAATREATRERGTDPGTGRQDGVGDGGVGEDGVGQDGDREDRIPAGRNGPGTTDARSAHTKAGEPKGADPRAGDPKAGDIDRAETARRLWRAVNRHLETLEADEAPDTVVRAAQNLATLARTLETLIDVERGLQAETQAHAAPQIDEGPEDIDEFRDELARRLEALCANALRKEETAADDPASGRDAFGLP